MPARQEIYKCPLCGNVIEIMHAGTCIPTCCGKPMQYMKEGATDGAKEKHVPVIEKTSDGYKVTVGSVAHPMEEKHYIEWIELLAGDKVCRQYLQPGQAPEATFALQEAKVCARAYCNLHGNWKAEN